jgi:hypothetical protein
VRGRFHKLRLVGAPPHPDLLHSPSQTGVNALMARGEKETAVLPGDVRMKRQSHNTSAVGACIPGASCRPHDEMLA